MIATKLTVNRKPSLSPKKQSKVRTQVRQLEIAATSGAGTDELRELANKAAQQVGQLGRFHKTPAAKLKSRIAVVRGNLPPEALSITTASANVRLDPNHLAPDALPWE